MLVGLLEERHAANSQHVLAFPLNMQWTGLLRRIESSLKSQGAGPWNT